MPVATSPMVLGSGVRVVARPAYAGTAAISSNTKAWAACLIRTSLQRDSTQSWPHLVSRECATSVRKSTEVGVHVRGHGRVRRAGLALSASAEPSRERR